MLDSEARAEPLCKLDSGGSVRSDALVDRDANQLDSLSAPQEIGEEDRGRARVLAATHADRDAIPTTEMDLGPELALRSSCDETQKVVATKLLPAVADPLHWGGGAAVTARVMTPPRTPATKRAPKRDHQ